MNKHNQVNDFRFDESIFRFLNDLAANNDREWFEKNRTRYETELIGPMQSFVNHIAPFVKTVDPDVMTDPGIDRVVSRIYRDLRFAKDKSPYKTYIRATFKRPDTDWKETPLYHFVIHREGFGHGIGFMRPVTDFMREWRSYIDGHENEMTKMSEEFADYQLRSDQFKRPKRKDLPPSLSQWYNSRNIMLIRYGSRDDLLTSIDIIGETIAEWSRLVPLYQLLWKLKRRTMK